jgi:hypothetical protein
MNQGVTPIAPEREMPPKKKADKPKRDDKAVKIDRLLADKATFIANRKGVTTAEFISELIRSSVEKEFAKMARETKEGGTK